MDSASEVTSPESSKALRSDWCKAHILAIRIDAKMCLHGPNWTGPVESYQGGSPLAAWLCFRQSACNAFPGARRWCNGICKAMDINSCRQFYDVLCCTTGKFLLTCCECQLEVNSMCQQGLSCCWASSTVLRQRGEEFMAPTLQQTQQQRTSGSNG